MGPVPGMLQSLIAGVARAGVFLHEVDDEIFSCKHRRGREGVQESDMAEVEAGQSQSLHESGVRLGGSRCKQVTSKTQVNDMRLKVGGHCCFWGASHQDQVWDRNQFYEKGLEEKKNCMDLGCIFHIVGKSEGIGRIILEKLSHEK